MYGAREENSPLPINQNGFSIICHTTLNKLNTQNPKKPQNQHWELGNRVGCHSEQKKKDPKLSWRRRESWMQISKTHRAEEGLLFLVYSKPLLRCCHKTTKARELFPVWTRHSDPSHRGLQINEPICLAFYTASTHRQSQVSKPPLFTRGCKCVLPIHKKWKMPYL